MTRTVTILGSTGSVGTQTVDVCRALGIGVDAITANSQVRLAEEQARLLHPRLAVMADERAAVDLRIRLADTSVRVLSGPEGVCEAAAGPADTVVSAVVGTAGLLPTMAAIREGKRIGFANKETLVCAGRLVTAAAEKYGAQLLPVDSEHSAIFQCLQAGNRRDAVRLLLTCSGGPYRGWSRERLEREAVPERTLQHPTWSMGDKITVDCATLMNKGLEYIEAMRLFQARTDEIRVLIHPQSIVHSLVEYADGSVIAQLGAPDMRIPIQYALTWPDRVPGPARKLDLSRAAALTFEEPDLETFGCLRLGMEAADKSDGVCAVLNGANEAAVALYLQKKIRFTDICDRVEEALRILHPEDASSLEDVLAADRAARRIVTENAAQ